MFKKERNSLWFNSYSIQVADTLKDNGTVDVFGFGKFSISERAARTGINPATKEKIEIAASKSVKFKASKALKDAVK